VQVTPTNSIERELLSEHVAIRRVELSLIKRRDDGTKHNEATVVAIADSIRLIGLQTPISVGPDFNIIAGELRFLAVKLLGLATIDCFVVTDTAVARLWQISENLHRNPLSALERSAALIQWAEAIDKDAQLEQVSGGRGKRGGIANAARTLGIDRSALRRAAAIASIPPDACAAIKEAGLDDNQSALLSIAATPAEHQLEKINEYSRSNSNPSSRAALQFESLMRAWEATDKRTRMRFIAEIVEPYTAQSQSETTGQAAVSDTQRTSEE
jgi:ParB-like chromosome segregation protein Spo0J